MAPDATGSVVRQLAFDTARVTSWRVSVRGVVQGVGFRPFVYKLATRLGLGGTVRNTARGVEIEVEGAPDVLGRFIDDLVAEAPAPAHIDEVRVEDVEARGHRDFTIERSHDGDGVLPIAPDIAACPACVEELLDPTDRRFGYPFTNCTACGPRFTIVRAVPYDRPNTTMAAFTMCAACRSEYDDPVPSVPRPAERLSGVRPASAPGGRRRAAGCR